MINEEMRIFLFDHIKLSNRLPDGPQIDDYINNYIDAAIESLEGTADWTKLTLYEQRSKILSTVTGMMYEKMKNVKL